LIHFIVRPALYIYVIKNILGVNMVQDKIRSIFLHTDQRCPKYCEEIITEMKICG